MTLADGLLRPRSVALLGASDDPAKTTARPLAFLRRSGFAGTIYPINPRRPTVLGERAWPSLEALPETPDHVFILAPTDDVAAALASCAERGVPVATILAGGYGEEGRAGLAREQALQQILAGGNTRLLGPNSIGIVNVASGLTLTANAAFAEDLPRGGLFVASHSGSMIGAISSRGKARGVGFAGFVSLGAELDLSLGEVCETTLDDPLVTSYALFLESIRHGRSLHRFALEAARRGRPIVAYKLGRSAQGAELSQSHTGAISGEDVVADAFLKDLGIARVETIDALVECPPLLARLPMPQACARPPRVAVVTTTGGGAAMVVDQLGVRGVRIAAPSAATREALAARGVAAAPGTIVDLTLAGTRPAVMAAALETLLTAPEFDLVIAVAGSSARFQPHLLVPAIVEAASAARPLVAFVAPDAPQALAALAFGGVPSFRSPETCADAIAAAFARRPPRALPPPPPGGGEQRQLDEAEGYALLTELGIPPARHAVVASSAKSSPIGYPVAVKLLSDAVLHKSDLGGVILGVADDAAFRDAAERIGALSSRLLVQAMTDGVGEVLIGFRRDADAGPIILLAAGGVQAELLQDRALRLAPVTRDQAWTMIGEVRLLAALNGYRGRPRGDLDGLADAIVALSRAGERVVEAEVNPLVVRQRGVTAIDAVVRVRAT
ncbi:acetate--CoA ligase family protein [uncultured Sphingomonas sp.]|uniref:acetate--CoA ligase family protein n=1 Tax=uncultured Sphingomonas sp. TaxID=158754 RepID=UPI0035CA1B85